MTPAAEQFRALMAGPEDAIRLDLACLLIAQHHDPAVDVRVHLGELDELARGCDRPEMAAIAEHLYGRLGFHGNRTDYYDPRNSLLPDVLARRTGIPITLAVVVIEVGRRLGLALQGVGMPGHFLVGTPDGYFDAFEGVVVDDDGCRARFEALRPGVPFRAEFLAPVPARAIVTRVLANLQAISFSSDLAAAARVVELRRMIPEQSVVERRALAQALAAVGRFDLAADELVSLSEDFPDLAEQFGREARQLRARTN